jgi:hypothetical protein
MGFSAKMLQSERIFFMFFGEFVVLSGIFPSISPIITILTKKGGYFLNGCGISGRMRRNSGLQYGITEPEGHTVDN